jgi:hypothetical protein
MPLQHELFEQRLDIQPPTDASGPRLWIRRVVIWREPGGDAIRDVELRPGFNIVWTPEDKGIGHGAGKTLFCRLLRYCLGEDRFAPDDQRAQIGAAFPNGLVGAEIILDGVCWAIIRPLGNRRRHLAVPNGNLEELAEIESASTGFEPFLDAIERAFLPIELASLIPGNRADRRGWPIALAWLMRDQECRFHGVLDWRSTESESDSPARGLNKTEKLDALRVFLQAITPEEQLKRREVAALDESRNELETEVGHRQWQIDQAKATLIPALGLTEDIFTDGALAKDVLLKAAQKQTDEASQLPSEESSNNIEQLKKEFETAQTEVNALDKQVGILNSDIPNIQRIMAKIAGEYPGLSYALQEAESFPCPICEVPVDRVLATKCGLSHKLPDLEACRLRLSKNREEFAAETARLAVAKNDRNLALRELSTVRQKAKELGDHIATLDAAQKNRSSNWESAKQRSIAVANLVELIDQQAKATKKLQKLNTEIDSERQLIAAFVDKQTPVFARLSEKFDPIIRHLVGAEARGSIALTGKGLTLAVQMGGKRSSSAIDSLKVIAFDISALCLSIEGKGNMPAFLVHDSPREADLGLDIYHRLFLFSRWLEGVGNQPLFQYIVTTTTPPPDNMKAKPWLRLTLRGTPERERLLSVDL